MFRLALLWILSVTFLAAAANAQAPDIPEPGSAEAIATATTDPHYVSPWVSYVPQSSTVPSPEKFLGRIMGAPGELLGTEKTYAYARALAAASPRVRVFTIGHSEEGRDILLIAIADEAGIRDLDRLKSATAALADPRRTDQTAAEKLIATSRPIYYFNAALHSDETGSTEAMVELAYRLAVSEQPMIRRIREKVVVLINPISNPDGRDKMVDWFYRYLKGKTDRNTLPRQSPPYWSKYTFVDINRDTHQQTHETTKAVHRMFHEWHPTVVHDLHEGSPLMMTWNGTGPYNPNIDPITYAEFLAMSFHEVAGHDGDGHARRLHLEFRRSLRASLSRFRGHEPQQHRPRLRNFRQRQRRNREAIRLCLSRQRAVVPPAPRPPRSPLVSPRQSQLPGNRSTLRPRRSRRRIPTNAAQLLQKVVGLLAERPDRAALRLRDSARSRRSRPRRRHGRAPDGPAHRSFARANCNPNQRRQLPCRNLRSPPRPALPKLRRRPAHPAALSQRWRTSLRRRLLGAPRQLSSASHPHRRRLNPRSRANSSSPTLHIPPATSPASAQSTC